MHITGALRWLSFAAAAAVAFAAVPAEGQRAFQRYWQERLQQMEDVEIIEDEAEPLDPEEERLLGEGPMAEQLGLTYFPGTGTQFGEEDREALRGYVQGVLSLGQRQAPVALEQLERALGHSPDSVWLRLRMANAAIQANDFSRAADILDGILEDDPENIRALLRKADLMLMRRRISEARRLFDEVLEIQPRNIEALQGITQMAFEMYGDLEMAKEYSGRILLIDDRNLNAMLWHAQASAYTGDPERAADYYTQLARFRPMFLDQMVDDARRLAAQGEVRDAIVLLERAVLFNPENSDARELWEQLQARTDGPRAVTEGYERLMEKDPNSLALHDVYARHLLMEEECPDPRECADRIDWGRLVSLRERSLERDGNHIPALLDLGVARLVQDGFEAAEPYYERAMAARPTNTAVLHEMAEVFLPFEEQRHRARQLYEQILLLSPTDARAMGALAEIKLEEGEREAALALLESALEEQPENAELLVRMGRLQFEQGDEEAGREFLKRATQAGPSDMDAWMELAEALLESGAEEALLDFEERALEEVPRKLEWSVLYGLLAQDHGRYDRSVPALERAVDENPHDLRARVALSRAYIKMDRPGEAVEVLREAEEHIGASRILVRMRDEYLVSVYIELHKYEEARELVSGLVEDFPGEMHFRELLLKTLVHLGESDAVEDLLDETIREYAEERPLETLLLRANVLLDKGEPERAMALLQDAEADYPEAEELLFRVAIAASEVEDLETAEKYYRRLMELGTPQTNPYFEVSANNLGYMFAQNRVRLDEAEDLVRKALEVNPNAPYILDSMGWVYYQQGDYERAQEYLERAAQRAFRDAEIYSNLGQLYEAIGKTDKAREYYKRAISVDPEIEPARERHEALAGSTGNVNNGGSPEL